MERLRPWQDAARPVQALLAPAGVAVGLGYARWDAHAGGGFLGPAAILLAAWVAGLGVQLIDQAWDLLGEPPGSPIDARDAATAGGIALALAGALGLSIAPVVGAAPLGYGAAAVILGLARGAPVVGLDTLGYGLGDLANVLALGPLASLAGYAARTGGGTLGAFLAGLPAGLVAASPLFARHFTRPEADAALSRMTPVVVLGLDQARRALVALPLLAVAAIVLAVRAGESGRLAFAACAPMVLAAALAFPLPPDPDPAVYERWQRRALACALAASALLVVGLIAV